MIEKGKEGIREVLEERMTEFGEGNEDMFEKVEKDDFDREEKILGRAFSLI